jgi:hypothetical protein
MKHHTVTEVTRGMGATPTEIDEDDAPSFSDVPLPSGGYVKQDDPEAFAAARAAVLDQSPIAALLVRPVLRPFDWYAERINNGGTRYLVRFEPSIEVGQIRESIEWIVTPTVSGPWKVERS